MGYRGVRQRCYNAPRVSQGTSPLFPFGHGLSYSTFVYSDLRVSGAVAPRRNATVSLSVANLAGSPAGREVVQVNA